MFRRNPSMGDYLADCLLVCLRCGRLLVEDIRYPPEDEIAAFYGRPHAAAAVALRQAPDGVFRQENLATGELREMFPTVGGASSIAATWPIWDKSASGGERSASDRCLSSSPRPPDGGGDRTARSAGRAR